MLDRGQVLDSRPRMTLRLAYAETITPSFMVYQGLSRTLTAPSSRSGRSWQSALPALCSLEAPPEVSTCMGAETEGVQMEIRIYPAMIAQLGGATLARVGKRSVAVQVAGRIYKCPLSVIQDSLDDGMRAAEVAKAYAYSHA